VVLDHLDHQERLVRLPACAWLPRLNVCACVRACDFSAVVNPWTLLISFHPHMEALCGSETLTMKTDVKMF